MDERRPYSVWTIIAPLAVVGVAAVALLLVLGALREPTARDAPAAAPPTTAVIDPSVPATYRIRKGDTLSGIAERYGVTADWILSLNPQLDPMALAVGTRINLRQPAAP